MLLFLLAFSISSLSYNTSVAEILIRFQSTKISGVLLRRKNVWCPRDVSTVKIEINRSIAVPNFSFSTLLTPVARRQGYERTMAAYLEPVRRFVASKAFARRVFEKRDRASGSRSTANGSQRSPNRIAPAKSPSRPNTAR